MMTGLSTGERLLRSLAHLCGVQTFYFGYGRHHQTAETDSLLAVLKALGVPLSTLSDVPGAYRETRLAHLQRVIEPVTPAWDGYLSIVRIRLLQSQADRDITGTLTQEDGVRHELRWRNDLPVYRLRKIDGATFVEKDLPVTLRLPPGYHKLSVGTGNQNSGTLVISAPTRVYSPGEKKNWGVFIPLYSLRSRRSWAGGDFTDMVQLTRWAADLGARSVSSLPLLAAFMDKPFEPSPYLPLSKLLWNEFYVDVTVSPELAGCPQAQELLGSSSFQRELQSLRRSRLVDYRRGMELKRQVLAELSRSFFSIDSPRRQDLEQFLEKHPEVEGYARFRAVMERQRKTWRRWPIRLQNGNITPGDFEEQVRRYHLYAQWLAHEQMGKVAANAAEQNVRLYLDLPLGVHSDGFDTWRYKNVFMNGISVGAPPDIVFTSGQNWAFPPLHPERLRETGYDYTIASLRHHLQYARILRLDHIMGLHRLFVIPHGMNGNQGVYMRYRPEELYAILSLESHRHQSFIVGEDLGIVPPEVRAAMSRHNLRRMYVMYYELASNAYPLLPTVPTTAVASYNTHDMPPFASFWSGQDIQDRLDTGIIKEPAVTGEQYTRAVVRGRLLAFLKERGLLKTPAMVSEILRACLTFLAASRARLVMVNLEDLWLETRTQNIPSTTREHPNWRHRAKYRFDDFCKMPRLLIILKEINRSRKGKGEFNGAGRKT